MTLHFRSFIHEESHKAKRVTGLRHIIGIGCTTFDQVDRIPNQAHIRRRQRPGKGQGQLFRTGKIGCSPRNGQNCLGKISDQRGLQPGSPPF